MYIILFSIIIMMTDLGIRIRLMFH